MHYHAVEIENVADEETPSHPDADVTYEVTGWAMVEGESVETGHWYADEVYANSDTELGVGTHLRIEAEVIDISIDVDAEGTTININTA